MLKRTLSQKKNKSYEDIPHACTIRFLDDSEPLSITYQKETKGDWLVDDVCRKLDLVEQDYFGLRYVDSDKQRHWLDPLKPIYKQLKQVYPPVLCFRVKFYPTDPTKLKEEITRYHLFLQLRRDLHHGRLLCSPDVANLLAAYIIQSEVGDYDPDEHQAGYVSQFKMLPKQTNKQEEKIAEKHKTLIGKAPCDVEVAFLEKASSLDTYGVDPHPVKDQKGNQMYLGVTHLGIVTFQGNKRTHLFKWVQITKIAFEGKMFIVHVTISEDSENELIVKKRGVGLLGCTASGLKKHACGFKCPTFSACKHLWKCAVEQQYFFTLERASAAPKVTSGGGWFSRGSRFRFSGRCQREVYSHSSHIERPAPNFERCVSNPSLVKSYNKKRSESLPNKLKDIALNNTVSSAMDESTQSLVAGELNLNSTPNGSLGGGNSTIHSIPRQDAVEVSDHPYEPVRSPSIGDIRQTSIDPIPEDHPLDTSTNQDLENQAHLINGIGTERPDLLPRYSQLDQEALVQSTAALQHTPVEHDDAQETEPMVPSSITSTEATVSNVAPISTQLGEEQTSQVPNLNNGHGVKPQTQQEETEQSSPEKADDDTGETKMVDTVTSEAPEKAKRNSRCSQVCRALTLVMFCVLTVSTILLVLALESDLEFPGLSDIRGMPEVQDFKHTFYNRFRSSIIKRIGGIFK